MDVINLLNDPKFSIPFLSTLGASLTVICLQIVNKDRTGKDKKIYATSYIVDICSRILLSMLFLKKHTIVPHIEAVRKIIVGDNKLLKTMFLADEFDILTDDPLSFNLLPEEYKVLLGCDDIDLLQAYETVIYAENNVKTRNDFNTFVRQNLKSELDFSNQSSDKQQDILNTYWDYLEKILHETDSNISFILYVLLPAVKIYIAKIQFIFFSKKNIKKIFNRVNVGLEKFNDILPNQSYLTKAITGGIQRAL